jgi:gamma-glutamyl:cysteine ligase YbdK (ATP-grasp superfamily)
MLSQVLGQLNELEVKIDDTVLLAGEARDLSGLIQTELDACITTVDTRNTYYTQELTGAHNV